MLVVGCAPIPARVCAAEFNFKPQEIETGLTVGYAVSLVDVNGDKKDDIVVVDSNRVLWYENPSWKQRTVIDGQTKRDNVCIAPYDIDGDGKIDFALGADWRPADTVNSGTIQWLRRGDSLDDKWTVFPIGTEPTVHRMRWADFDADGRAELIVSPLHGRGNRGPKFEGAGVRTLRYAIPKDPTQQDQWKAEVINDEVHVSHNLWPTDLDRDGKLDLLLASFEGVNLRRARRREVEADADRFGQSRDQPQPRVERDQARPANAKARLHCDDRAVAWVSGGRLHAARRSASGGTE